mgnify:CR=1 FL=1
MKRLFKAIINELGVENTLTFLAGAVADLENEEAKKVAIELYSIRNRINKIELTRDLERK